MKTTISNSDDVIDSRDVIERIEQLESEIESAEIPANEVGGPKDTMEEERNELVALKGLQDEAEGYSDDWRHGATLIRDSYFQQYAQDLADDIGAINKDATWPCNCIDWEEAADQLKQDYTQVDFDGVEYWVR